MSKMDNLRAMREARYEQAKARGAQAGPSRPVLPQAGPPETDAGAELCGHRAISGRTCTREAGHSAKSHRYA